MIEHLNSALKQYVALSRTYYVEYHQEIFLCEIVEYNKHKWLPLCTTINYKFINQYHTCLNSSKYGVTWTVGRGSVTFHEWICCYSKHLQHPIHFSDEANADCFVQYFYGHGIPVCRRRRLIIISFIWIDKSETVTMLPLN